MDEQFNYDGINVLIYYLLWLKDGQNYFSFENVRIPHTIIIKDHTLMQWYFCKNSGEILKKSSNQFCIENILKIFKNFDKLGIGIVAFLLTNDSNNVEIKYLTYDQLKYFLEHEKKPRVAVLQEFIEPKSNYNSGKFNSDCIQVLWSPTLELFFKKTNLNCIHDKRLDPFERLCTFEGPESSCLSTPLRGLKSTLLSNITSDMLNVNNIIKHISVTSFQTFVPKRANLFFKEGKNGIIYFLFSLGLRVEKHETKRKLKYSQTEIEITVPEKRYNKLENIPLKLSEDLELRLSNKSESLRKPVECANCNTKCKLESFHAVTFGNLIHSQKEKGVLPNFIRKFFPKINLKELDQLLKLEFFRKKEIYICESCFMSIDFQPTQKFSQHQNFQHTLGSKAVFALIKFSIIKQDLQEKKSIFERRFSSCSRLRKNIFPISSISTARESNVSKGGKFESRSLSKKSHFPLKKISSSQNIVEVKPLKNLKLEEKKQKVNIFVSSHSTTNSISNLKEIYGVN